MKKLYTSPVMEQMTLLSADVITYSNYSEPTEQDELDIQISAPGGWFGQ